ncbi:MAG: GAF domain-containing protein [Mariprofundaceae bacterium]|nr:GAF domain-containing protein [Mariprofundaceae bacterium]
MSLYANHLKINLRWLGLVLAIIYWLMEALLHTFYWKIAPLSVTLLAQSEPDELSMRLVIAALLIGFGFFAETNRQRVLKDLYQQERTSRLLRFLSDCNQNVQRQPDEKALLDAACVSAVEIGKFRFAWIGMQRGNKLEMAAWAAADEALVEEVTRLQEPGALHLCLACQSVLEKGVIELCELRDREACKAPWLSPFLKLGCEHAAVLPLIVEGRTVGVFEVYAGEDGQIADEEQTILGEVANDISVALNNIVLEAERRQRAEDLAARVDELERFQRATVDREFRIKELRDELAELKKEHREKQP